jgi:hypothetical protein
VSRRAETLKGAVSEKRCLTGTEFGSPYSATKSVSAITLDVGSVTIYGRAAALLAVDMERTAVQFGQPPSERQPQTGAFVFTGESGIDLTKGFQGDLDLVRRHPQPGIAHLERHTAVCSLAAGREH